MAARGALRNIEERERLLQLELPDMPKVQAPEAPPKPEEYRLHCALADILRRFLNPAWRATHLPMGEKRSKATALRLKRMYVTAGWPDFIFVGPGCVFWLELKRPGHNLKLHEAQLNMQTHLVRCGFPYLVTNDLKDAIGTLQDLGILPRGIRVQ